MSRFTNVLASLLVLAIFTGLTIGIVMYFRAMFQHDAAKPAGEMSAARLSAEPQKTAPPVAAGETLPVPSAGAASSPPAIVEESKPVPAEPEVAARPVESVSPAEEESLPPPLPPALEFLEKGAPTAVPRPPGPESADAQDAGREPSPVSPAPASVPAPAAQAAAPAGDSPPAGSFVERGELPAQDRAGGQQQAAQPSPVAPVVPGTAGATAEPLPAPAAPAAAPAYQAPQQGGWGAPPAPGYSYPGYPPAGYPGGYPPPRYPGWGYPRQYY